MKRFVRGSACSRLLPLAAVAAVALASAAAAPALATAGAARPSHAVYSGRAVPAVGTHPVVLRAGTAGAAFSCEAVDAAVRCYTPDQLRTAYGWNDFKNAGAGETVVIVDAFQSPTLRHDVALEDSVFGLPTPNLKIIAPEGLTPFNPANGDMVGWSAEISLDVESVNTYAPHAKIILDLAKSDQDAAILAATRYAVDNNLGDVISQSFGEAEVCMAPSLVKQQHKLFEKAVKKGISVFASSGDNGAAQATCNGKSTLLSASTPASDPNVTGVGATNLFLTKHGKWTGEVAWNDGFGESGGGVSVLYPAPSYQKSLGVPARTVPDVAYNGGVNGGILIAWSSSGEGKNLIFIFGGTSAGSPAWASLGAIADQTAGHRLGALNPRIYKIAESKAYSSDFHDITIGNNIEPGVGGYYTEPGYDLVTGWGTPKLPWLIPALAGS